MLNRLSDDINYIVKYEVYLGILAKFFFSSGSFFLTASTATLQAKIKITFLKKSTYIQPGSDNLSSLQLSEAGLKTTAIIENRTEYGSQYYSIDSITILL